MTWGCDKDSPKRGGYQYDLGGIRTRRCPLALLKQRWVQEALVLHAMYKRGITPNGRGLRHETAFYREVMVSLDGLSAEAESWYSKQLEARSKRGKGK